MIPPSAPLPTLPGSGTSVHRAGVLCGNAPLDARDVRPLPALEILPFASEGAVLWLLQRSNHLQLSQRVFNISLQPSREYYDPPLQV